MVARLNPVQKAACSNHVYVATFLSVFTSRCDIILIVILSVFTSRLRVQITSRSTILSVFTSRCLWHYLSCYICASEEMLT